MVSRVNLPIPTPMRLQISYSFWLSLQFVEFLQHSSPHLIVHRAHNFNSKINYLRYNFKNRLGYDILGNMFFDHQNQWGGLTKSYITFDLFDISWRNLVLVRRNEWPSRLYNLF